MAFLFAAETNHLGFAKWLGEAQTLETAGVRRLFRLKYGMFSLFQQI
jgi:hypothetical protein